MKLHIQFNHFSINFSLYEIYPIQILYIIFYTKNIIEKRIKVFIHLHNFYWRWVSCSNGGDAIGGIYHKYNIYVPLDIDIKNSTSSYLHYFPPTIFTPSLPFSYAHSSGMGLPGYLYLCMTKYVWKIPHDVMKCFAHSFGSFHTPRIEFHDVKSSDVMP